MSTRRLDSEERRQAIITAALPLFARRGFSGTTTKLIADSAGVSEALLFKHFPSKQALYQEIVLLGCEGTPELEALAQLEDTSAGLIELIDMMIEHFLIELAQENSAGTLSDCGIRHRMRINSLLEDGEFARLSAEWVTSHVYPKFAACLAAASRSGDLLADAPAPENAFWFAEHIAAMIATTRLAADHRGPYQGGDDAIHRQAVLFVLRGIGLKDDAITEYYAHGQARDMRSAAGSDQKRI
jgi:AcrR family transcriptional regulator